MKNNYCDIQDNCEIVKQLKAEVEQLKEQYKWYDHYKESALYNKDLCNKQSWEIGNLGYKIKNQRKEINKLQQQLNQFKKMLEDKDVQLALTEIRSGERHLWYNKAEKYEQTLTEIKDIVCRLPISVTRQQILQKISECEEIE